MDGSSAALAASVATVVVATAAGAATFPAVFTSSFSREPEVDERGLAGPLEAEAVAFVAVFAVFAFFVGLDGAEAEADAEGPVRALATDEVVGLLSRSEAAAPAPAGRLGCAGTAGALLRAFASEAAVGAYRPELGVFGRERAEAERAGVDCACVEASLDLVGASLGADDVLAAAGLEADVLATVGFGGAEAVGRSLRDEGDPLEGDLGVGFGFSCC